MVGEVALVAEPALDGDIGEGEFGLPEQMACTFDPLADEELVRGKAGGLFETAGEVERAEAGSAGDVEEGKILGEMAPDEFDGLAELMRGEGSGMGGGGGGGPGVMMSDMSAEGLGQALHVDATVGVAGADFVADSIAEGLDDGVVDAALGDDFDEASLVAARGAVEEELGGDGYDVESSGIAGSGGEDGSRGEEADLAGTDPVEAEGAAVVGYLEFIDAFEVDGEEVVDGAGRGDVDVADAMLLDPGGGSRGGI
jgi:hypothetical protein